MSRADDLGRFGWLLRHYLLPHWPAVALLLVGSALGTVLSAVFPVLMAPILDLALGGTAARAGPGQRPHAEQPGRGLLRVDRRRRRRRSVPRRSSSCAWPTSPSACSRAGSTSATTCSRCGSACAPGTALQADLFRHLLALSMRFFTRHRTGELVSRLYTDTLGATAGLETIVGTARQRAGPDPVLRLPAGQHEPAAGRGGGRRGGAALRRHARHPGADPALHRRPVLGAGRAGRAVPGDAAEHPHGEVVRRRAVRAASAGRRSRGRVRVNVKRGAYKHVEEPARAVVNYVVEAGLILLAVCELMAGRLTAPTFFLFLYVGRAAMVQIGLLACGLHDRAQRAGGGRPRLRAVRGDARRPSTAGSRSASFAIASRFATCRSATATSRC